jgi:DNA-damage-inducible protein D
MNSDNDEPITPRTSPFESIRRQTEDGSEYWSARELAKILGYTEYGKFQNAIQKAETACKNSGQAISDHFAHMSDMIATGKGARRKVVDVRLSRYACYLLVENADSSKPIVALGQTYFAVQTRRQELTDELVGISEDQLRLIRRSQMSVHNSQLAEAAQKSGVIEPIDFAVFQDHGYQGLYGGLRARDIHARKGLRKNEEILDYMGSDELAANAFRASLTRQKLERERVKGKENANRTHHEMGRKQIQHKEHKRLKQGQQPLLFDQSEGIEK